jgi:hypothetical protein
MFQSFIWLLTAPVDRFSLGHPNRPPSIPVDWERCQSTKNIRSDFLSTGTRWHIMMRDRAETPTPIAPSRAYAVESGKHDQAETAEIEYSLADIRGIRRNSGPARDTCTCLFCSRASGAKGEMRDQAESHAPTNALAGVFGSRSKRRPGRDLPQDLPTDPIGAEGSPPELAPRGRKVLEENKTQKTNENTHYKKTKQRDIKELWLS